MSHGRHSNTVSIRLIGMINKVRIFDYAALTIEKADVERFVISATLFGYAPQRLNFSDYVDFIALITENARPVTSCRLKRFVCQLTA